MINFGSPTYLPAILGPGNSITAALGYTNPDQITGCQGWQRRWRGRIARCSCGCTAAARSHG
jgi:hypothetical protein